MSSPPSLAYSIIPSGGAVLLTPYSSDTSITLTRQVVGQPDSVILYEGPMQESLYHLDLGEGQGVVAPLSQTTQYIYTITDSYGTYSTPPVTPVIYTSINEDHFTKIILRLFETGIKSLYIPKGFKKRPTVLYSMPLNGFPPLPAIHIYQDYMASKEIPIGQQAVSPGNDNAYNMSTIVDRHFLVTVLCDSSEEREFYRTAIIAIFLSILANPIQILGNNIRHSFDSSSDQVKGEGRNPGFYFADIGISFSGIYNVTLNYDYSLIEKFDLDVNDETGNSSTII